MVARLPIPVAAGWPDIKSVRVAAVERTGPVACPAATGSGSRTYAGWGPLSCPGSGQAGKGPCGGLLR